MTFTRVAALLLGTVLCLDLHVYAQPASIEEAQRWRDIAIRIQPATLVHEAYLRLARHAPPQLDRTQILALAAHAMRQVLVDRARERNAEKRGGDWARVSLTDGIATAAIDHTEFLALNDAIERLDPRQRQVIECRFFAGLDDAETAAALGITTRTVQRDWTKARAWLGRWLREGAAE